MEEEKTIEGKPKKEEKVVEEKAPVEKKEEVVSAKKKKIRNMSLKEVEEKLKSVESMMGGFSSKYAQHLLRRKEELAKGWTNALAAEGHRKIQRHKKNFKPQISQDFINITGILRDGKAKNGTTNYTNK